MTHITRRRALLGMLAAPAIIRTAGLLMPVKAVPVVAPGYIVFEGMNFRITGWTFHPDRRIVYHFTARPIDAGPDRISGEVVAELVDGGTFRPSSA